MSDLLWVSIGGAIGAAVRYVLGIWIIGRMGASFPWNTMVVNISGGLAIGISLTLLTERIIADPAWRLLLVVGFLGGYTTFSSYTFEALALLEAGAWFSAAWYVLGSNGLGLLATYLGIVLARVLIH